MDIARINKAKKLARQYHTGQTYNNKKYYNAHLIPVMELAEILAPEELKEDVIIVSLLQDILEDTNCNPEYIEEIFGIDILRLVILLTKGANKRYEKYITYIADNRIAKIVKTADRLVNIYHLKDIKDQQKKEELIKKYEDQIKYIKAYF